MRISRIAIIVLALFISPFISVSSASADDKKPNTSQKKTEIKAEYKNALDQFRKEFKEYEDQRREINRIYKEAIDNALADARLAKSVKQTQIEKRQSMNARQSAVIAATVARDTAMEALGSSPSAPVQPGKIPSAAKNKSPKAEKSSTAKK